MTIILTKNTETQHEKATYKDFFVRCVYISYQNSTFSVEIGAGAVKVKFHKTSRKQEKRIEKSVSFVYNEIKK